jgi:hypothetical protein
MRDRSACLILRSDGKILAAGPAGFSMDPVSEQESIRNLSGRDFDLLLTGHGAPLRPRVAEKVREFAAALPIHRQVQKNPDYSG